MSDDLAAQLVTAATEAIVQSWSPETEYDEAGHAAVVATLRELRKQRILFIYEGHLGTTHTPQPGDLVREIEPPPPCSPEEVARAQGQRPATAAERAMGNADANGTFVHRTPGGDHG